VCLHVSVCERERDRMCACICVRACTRNIQVMCLKIEKLECFWSNMIKTGQAYINRVYSYIHARTYITIHMHYIYVYRYI